MFTKEQAAADPEMQAELARIESFTLMQLYDVTARIGDDPAPQFVKDLILEKVRSELNRRIGL